MTAFLIAMGAALGLACLRLAATQFESAYYQFQNGEHAKARRCFFRACTFVLLLALILTPVVRFFDSFEVISTYETLPMVAPKASTDLRV